MLEVQDLGMVMILMGAGLGWMLILAAIVSIASASPLKRAEPPPPPPMPTPLEEDEAPLSELDEADRPMAVVIVATARGPGSHRAEPPYGREP